MPTRFLMMSAIHNDNHSIFYLLIHVNMESWRQTDGGRKLQKITRTVSVALMSMSTTVERASFSVRDFWFIM
jgi:hypothetical protein